MLWAVCSKTASQYSEERETTPTDKHIPPPPQTFHICSTSSMLSILPMADTLPALQLEIAPKVHTCHCVLTARCQPSVCSDAAFAASAVWRRAIGKTPLIVMLWPVGRATMSQASPGDSFEAVLFRCTVGFSTTVRIQWV